MLCKRVCVCVHVCVLVSIYTIHAHICTCVYMHVHVCACLCVHKYGCVLCLLLINTYFRAGIKCSKIVRVRWVRGLVRRVLLNDNSAFLRTRGVVAVEYRPENRAPDFRLKNGLGDVAAAADELSGYLKRTK